MDYTVIRSKRKSIAVQVVAGPLVLVRAPQRMPAAAIEAFVKRHEGWIADRVEKQKIRMALHPEPNADELLELKRLARETLPERVRHFSAIMGLSPTKVTITSAKTRFGSCSPKNAVCFSCRLMSYPGRAIDYVVVHELAHIRHKNHGREFYALIACVLPDYKERRALLKL